LTQLPKSESRAKNPQRHPRGIRTVHRIQQKGDDQFANGDETKRAELEKWAQEVADKIPVDPTRQRIGAIAKAIWPRPKMSSPARLSPSKPKSKSICRLWKTSTYRDDSGLPEKTSLARLIGRYVKPFLTNTTT
jgi:hypothetical protein